MVIKVYLNSGEVVTIGAVKEYNCAASQHALIIRKIGGNEYIFPYSSVKYFEIEK